MTSPTDFQAVQRQAMQEGTPLPPSTLRAMLDFESSPEEAVGVSKSAEPRVGMAITRSDSRPQRASAFMLMLLPECVILHILAFLDAPALWILPAVSPQLGFLARSNHLWRALLIRRFEPVRWALPLNALEPSTLVNCRELYASLSSPGEGSWQRLVVSGHSSEESCWLVLHHVIYDVTPFMHRHPGMAASLLLFGGSPLPNLAHCLDENIGLAICRTCANLWVGLRRLTMLSSRVSLPTKVLATGTDATLAFEEVPHSKVAHRFMRTLRVPGLELQFEGCPSRRPLVSTQPLSSSRAERFKEFVLSSTPFPSLWERLCKERTLDEMMSAFLSKGYFRDAIGNAFAVGGS